MAADLGTALISASAALVGSFIGLLSAQRAARGTRESDRRKRCVDRVLSAITNLEKAFAEYATAAVDERDSPKVALPLEGALRGYTQAVELLHIESLRNAAVRYQEMLTHYYLRYGQPRDELDAERAAPTLQQLNDEHFYLAGKLRNYEKT
ncbi:hypothetical protein [Mycolicibacterium arenosum]|uniref:Uncharacterized protein n=1 Tax=Mycolicibacterium arenosum TaxID=2952157 RepID=A0ABT1MBM8_9MYCO|nr:hypothetical protein [Mycolicibacterium sp. CAU 1645]MCP9276553.1 hypothetical protein [Mycolicibacterium sp. CAU 1645]